MPYAFCHISGKLAVTFHALHKEYGPVVRTAPNELSFIEPEALRTIYAERTKLCPVFKKNYDAFNETRNQIAHSVFIAGDSDHARMRKIINHAFSERALRDQEPRIQSQVQTLILGLDSARTKTGIVDLNEWYNCAAFDIIADAAFGEPFNTLQEPTYRSWLYLIGMTWKAITFASAIKSIAPRLYIFRRLIPTGRMLQKEVDKFNLILDRVRERMVVETGRIDLLSLVMKNNTNEKEKMTDQEVISNATLFVAAGTETVTTLLSALTYLLTRHGRIMKKLSEEIRNSFLNESLITVQSVSQLQYLTACIQEALRLFPPIPEGLPRVVPSGGEDICGQRIPGGVCALLDSSRMHLSTILQLTSGRLSYKSVTWQPVYLHPTLQTRSPSYLNAGLESTRDFLPTRSKHRSRFLLVHAIVSVKGKNKDPLSLLGNHN